jgi:hypothetical protein
VKYATLEDLQSLAPATLGDDAARFYSDVARIPNLPRLDVERPRWLGWSKDRHHDRKVRLSLRLAPMGWTEGRLLVVERLRDKDAVFRGGTMACPEAMARMRLVGLELPGRHCVMVGDERTVLGRTWRVVEIQPHAQLSLQEAGWSSCTTVYAATFAAWASRDEWPAQQPEQWDRVTIGGVTLGADQELAEPTAEQIERVRELTRGFLLKGYSVPEPRLPERGVTVPAEPVATATREARRREIDAILREDAHAVPAFAQARLRAAMAALDPPPLIQATVPEGDALREAVERCVAERGHVGVMPQDMKIEVVDEERDQPALARDILAELHHYEAHRGGEMRPRRDLTRWLPPAVHEAVEVYERSLGLA